MLGQHLNSRLSRQPKYKGTQTSKIKQGEKLGSRREKIKNTATNLTFILVAWRIW